MPLRRRLAMALPAALPVLAACGTDRALGLLDRLTPDSGLLRSDARYGPHPRQALTAYAPPAASGAPLCVFLYGGAWTTGTRHDYRFVAEALGRRGIVTVLADYRLHPEVRYGAMQGDAAAATGWAFAHAAALGADPRRITLAGHSAGGMMALGLALDARHLAAVGRDRAALAGVAAIAPATGYEPLRGQHYTDLFAEVAPPDSHRPRRWPPPALLARRRSD